MIKNYLKSAWRNMMRSRLYTAINIFCLTVGISGAIFITLYLNHEFSYDNHHENHESIYFLHGNYTIGGNENPLALTPFPLGPALKAEFSGIKDFVRFFRIEDAMVKVEDRDFIENEIVFTDSTVFDVFTHQFVYGRPQGALAEPNTAVLGRKLSEKLFGKGNPVGKVFELNDDNYKVTAMIEDLPDNTHMKYDGLLSIHSNNHHWAYSLEPELFWNINVNYTYVRVHQDVDINSILGDMEAFNEKYVSPVGSMLGASAEFFSTPLRETHFTRLVLGEETGNRTTLLIFTIVALFLILIAAVNYTNLATARAANRSREIGLRKVSGASRRQLIVQFLSESLVVALISLLLSLVVVQIFLPGFNALANKTFVFSDLLNEQIFLQILIITAVTGLVAGIYPAIFLSRMQPVKVLKSANQSKGGSGMLRKLLVVFQFIISIILIAGTITVEKQLSYLQNKDLGFNKSNRMVVAFGNRDVRQRIETLENTLRSNPMILKTTKTTMVPGRGANILAVKVQSGDEMKDATMTTSHVDPSFLDVMEIELLNGRGFHEDMKADATSSVIVNEAAVRTFGWHDEPLGKTVQWMFDENGVPRLTLKVVGVIEDFNYATLQNPVDPLMLLVPEEPVTFQAIIVEYQEGAQQQVKAFLENTMRQFDPERIPNVQTLDHGFIEQFSSEERLGKIFGIFTLVCIAISFLGLFGLSSFTTSQRKKEVGIRKVLGSSGRKILLLFYKDFSVLILIALLISAPVAWILMDRWLEGFVYHINMSISYILIAGFLSLAVAVLTVSYHTLMASRMNPSQAIRSE